MIPAIERFHEKIERIPFSTCWWWTGSADKRGYGHFFPMRGQCEMAHRVAFMLYKGPIGDGLQVHHVCENKSCVNPEHLEAVTPRVNLLASNTVNKRNAAKTQCPRGHPLSGENLVLEVRRSGLIRTCRECKRVQLRESRARRKGISCQS